MLYNLSMVVYSIVMKWRICNEILMLYCGIVNDEMVVNVIIIIKIGLIIFVCIVVFLIINLLIIFIVGLIGFGNLSLVFFKILIVIFMNKVFIRVGNGISDFVFIMEIVNLVGIIFGWNEINVIYKVGVKRERIIVI